MEPSTKFPSKGKNFATLQLHSVCVNCCASFYDYPQDQQSVAGPREKENHNHITRFYEISATEESSVSFEAHSYSTLSKQNCTESEKNCQRDENTTTQFPLIKLTNATVLSSIYKLNYLNVCESSKSKRANRNRSWNILNGNIMDAENSDILDTNVDPDVDVDKEGENDHQQQLPLCNCCTEALTLLHKAFTNFNRLRNQNSYLRHKLAKLDELMYKFQNQSKEQDQVHRESQIDFNKLPLQNQERHSLNQRHTNTHVVNNNNSLSQTQITTEVDPLLIKREVDTDTINCDYADNDDDGGCEDKDGEANVETSNDFHAKNFISPGTINQVFGRSTLSQGQVQGRNLKVGPPWVSLRRLRSSDILKASTANPSVIKGKMLRSRSSHFHLHSKIVSDGDCDDDISDPLAQSYSDANVEEGNHNSDRNNEMTTDPEWKSSQKANTIKESYKSLKVPTIGSHRRKVSSVQVPKVQSHTSKRTKNPQRKTVEDQQVNPKPKKRDIKKLRFCEMFKLRKLKSPYPCRYCQLDYQTESERINHVHASHISKKDRSYKYVVCGPCGTLLRNDSALKSHLPKCGKPPKGTRLPPFFCEHCNKEFGKVNALTAHKKFVHPMSDEGPFHCDLCPYKGRMKALLLSHRKTHETQESTEAQVQCHVCKKMYRNKTSLQSHFHRLHTEEGRRIYYAAEERRRQSVKAKKLKLQGGDPNSFLCIECNIDFQTKVRLTNHRLAVHIKEKKFMCEQCGKGFICSYRLKRHIAFAHTEERPFICEQCGKSYKSNTNLDTHIQRCHDEQGRLKYNEYSRDKNRKLAALAKALASASGSSSASTTTITSTSNATSLLGPLVNDPNPGDLEEPTATTVYNNLQ